MADPVDILGLGAVAVDDILYLDEFPKPDSKGPIQREERHAGGLTGTALVAARRMGRSCSYAGTLGHDELSRFIVDGFAAEGVSTRHLVRREGTHPFHSTILVDTQTRTRTILFDARDVVGADPDSPAEEVVRAAKVLFVDHVGLRGMVRAARVARAAGIPVVADLERDVGELFPALVGLIDHLILPFDFAARISGARDPAGILRALWTAERRSVVVTRSEEGSWYTSVDEPGRIFHQPAFSVDAVDTNGCGDVFHGVYAASLAEGMPMERRVKFAASVAALKATHPGGQKGIPLRAEADRFFAAQEGRFPRSQA